MTKQGQEIAHLQNLQAEHRKNIRTLQEQLAKHGMTPPLSLLNELEHEQEKLCQVEERLTEMEAQARTEEVPAAPPPEGEKGGRNITLIVAVVLIVLCCCLIAVVATSILSGDEILREIL